MTGEVKQLFDLCTKNYNQLVKDNKIDKVIGRDEELERIEQILSKRKKNNLILVGSGGVGKTTILHALAERIVNETCSPNLIGKEILEIDLTSIVADSKFRGDFEGKIKKLINEINKKGNIIAFIDEIHMLVGSGASSSDSSDGANILKPALADGTLQLIGATTYKEYNRTIGKDSALERRFQKMIIKEPNGEETLRIITKLSDLYGKHHNVIYNRNVLKEIVELSDRYLTNRNQPDKSIDVMDEIGSMIRTGKAKEKSPELIELEKNLQIIIAEKESAIQKENYKVGEKLLIAEIQCIKDIDIARKKHKVKHISPKKIVVNTDDVHTVIASMSGIPKDNISRQKDVKSDMENMDKTLKNLVIGQDEAITAIVKHIQKTKLGLKKDDKPASFLFLGSSGCGKTLLSKELTEYLLGDKKFLVRINMNEYSEKHSVSRLIGSAPGYVGYGNGGELTNKVKDMPYCVILFDEIEKAHPDVMDILLQLLDEGILTDSEGVTVNFKNAIVIMTSNIGTKKLKDFGNGVGFKSGDVSVDRNKKLLMKELEKTLKPEVINRLGSVVIFNDLSSDNLHSILDIYIKDLSKRMKNLGDNGFGLSVSDNMLNKIVADGKNSSYGARLIERVFNTLIEDKVTEYLLNDIKEGTVIKVDYINDETLITI